MKFATLEGKLVQSGGMVVKNVAGLDMAKLMIGSFGTLAAIAVVNFKLTPAPEVERTFLLAFKGLEDAVAARNRLLASALQPVAVDLLNPAAGASLEARFLGPGHPRGRQHGPRWTASSGNWAPLADWSACEGPEQDALWERMSNFTPAFLERNPDGAVVRASCTLKGLEEVMASFPGSGAGARGIGRLLRVLRGIRSRGGAGFPKPSGAAGKP